MLTAAGILTASPALAQNAGGVIPLDEVVVEGATGDGTESGDGPVGDYVASQSLTGTKTDTPITKTPQSIAVVPAEQIEDQDAQSVAEALRYTPGVFSEYRGASNLRDEVFVRGFYYVPRYLDGLYFGGDLSYARIDPYFLERIELLSGPSSVLYGQANPGGIINMTSKLPTETPRGEVRTTFGSGDYVGASFDVSGPVPGVDTLSYRLVGTGFRRDLQEEFTKQSLLGITPSVTWRPDATTSLTILGGYQYEPDAGFRNFLDAAGTVSPIAGYGYVPRDFFVSDPDYEELTREQYWIGSKFEHEFNDILTVRQNARYQHVDHTHHTLIWGYTSASPTTGADTIVHRTASGGDESWDQFVIDNQAQVDVTTGPVSHTLLGGLDYRYRVRDYIWGRNSDVPTIDLANPTYGTIDYDSVALTTSDDQDLTAQQVGLYLQEQAEWGRLNVMAGGRVDFASTDIDDNLAGTSTSYDDTAFTWRVGAIYDLGWGISPYASYSTSFEPSLYAPPAGESAFEPTTADQLEVGVKYAPEGYDFLLTAAYYDITQRNVVQGTWDPALAQTVYRQIGEIHNRGVELSARGELFDRLSLIASYSYIHSEIEKSVAASEVGKTPARIPEHQASLWAKYAFKNPRLYGLELGGGVRYIGTSQGNNENTFQVDGVTLFDAMASYDFGALDSDLEGLKLQVNVKNIADTKYVASCASAYACFYGEGRTILASLAYQW
ncbi:TonB-dependent siderophore receptor [Acuticoccus mangrovi]|uniref:TonB-dependent siderophore receptor n=1 Tax=Acuticoccus mangrovi TaxID=2796142 RepID=A0A934MFK6_9HYPH|nr:TonB-dependent siderophore receptor [Acuticoccus mangrovi]MBJ3778767.1 TonB-dependent siderophore receptor [Acuticoccus mangrovi]